MGGVLFSPRGGPEERRAFSRRMRCPASPLVCCGGPAAKACGSLRVAPETPVLKARETKARCFKPRDPHFKRRMAA